MKNQSYMPYFHEFCAGISQSDTLVYNFHNGKHTLYLLHWSH